MNELTSLLGIGIALGLGAASPGPSFVMIARTAASAGRARGLSAALGMGLGAVLFASASLLGLNAVFRAVPTLYVALKLGGGCYLAYLGWRIWRGAGQALEVRAEEGASPSARGRRASLLLGLATQLSNPKTALVYASVFAAFLPAAPGLRYQLAVVVLVFLVETGWYALVAAALSAAAPRALYLRHKKWLDRAAGGLMGALGLKLAASAADPR